MVRKEVVLFTTRPQPPARIIGSASRSSIAGARTLIAKKRSQAAASSSSMDGRRVSASGRRLETPMPALFTSASTPPKRSTAAATPAAQPSAVERSASTGCSGAPGCASISADIAPASRSSAATRWPAASTAATMARPIPPAAPVISTVRGVIAAMGSFLRFPPPA